MLTNRPDPTLLEPGRDTGAWADLQVPVIAVLAVVVFAAMRHRVQEEVVLHATDHLVQAAIVRRSTRAKSSRSSRLALRKSAWCCRAVCGSPTRSGWRRFDRDEALATFDDVLPDVDLAPDLPRISVVDRRLVGQASSISEQNTQWFSFLWYSRLCWTSFCTFSGTTGVAMIWLCVCAMLAPGGGTEVLEHQHIFQTAVGRVQLGHALLVDGKEVRQVLPGSSRAGDPVAGVVDYHLVPAISIDHLLQAEGDVRLCAVIAEHRDRGSARSESPRHPRPGRT